MSFSVSKIESDLRKRVAHDPAYKAFREKTTKLHVLGLRLPVLNAYAKSLSLSHQELDDLWKNTNMHEAMTVALLVLIRQKRAIDKSVWLMLKTWIDKIENWEHSDNLSALYSLVVEFHPDWILPTLKKWNRSKNPWEQRASIVPLIYYASPKRKAPPVNLVLELVEPLIPSKDKYVNKAVGWTLRESYKLYPKETFAFIKKHIRELAAESFSYATERVTKIEKLELKKLRAIK